LATGAAGVSLSRPTLASPLAENSVIQKAQYANELLAVTGATGFDTAGCAFNPLGPPWDPLILGILDNLRGCLRDASEFQGLLSISRSFPRRCFQDASKEIAGVDLDR